MLVIVGVIAMLVVGCASGPTVYRDADVPQATMDAYLSGKPARLGPMYRKVMLEGQRNQVLNQEQCGLAAMDIGAFDAARGSFDESLNYIETIYANNETAKKARSLWYEEGMKDFKGEPYERAMAYYYRGIIYLRDGDYQNARACFKSAMLQDAFAEEHQHQCDFALMAFLYGWSSQCNGEMDMANAAYKEVKELRPDFKAPLPNDNVLIIAETGTAPRKLADGVGHYELVYRRGKFFTEKRTQLTINQRMYNMYPMEDIAWQAMTRGGRAIDRILEGQVEFRRTHEKIGTTLTEISSTAMIAAPAFESATSEIQIASGVLGLIGVTQLAMAQNARPRADTRYWKNLPDTVHVFTCAMPTGDNVNVRATFLDAEKAKIVNLDKTKPIHFVKSNGLCWIRSRSAVINNP